MGPKSGPRARWPGDSLGFSYARRLTFCLVRAHRSRDISLSGALNATSANAIPNQTSVPSCLCPGAPMKILVALGVSVLSVGHAPAQGVVSGSVAAPAANYGKLPLSFEANQGQADPQVRCLSHGSGYSLFLTDSAAVLALTKGSPSKKISRAVLPFWPIRNAAGTERVEERSSTDGA